MSTFSFKVKYWDDVTDSRRNQEGHRKCKTPLLPKYKDVLVCEFRIQM